MHWLWVFLVGLVIGILAKLVSPGRDPGGFIITGLLGIAGSVLASYIGERLQLWGPVGAAHFLASIGGAVILLAIYHWLFGRNAAA